MSETPTESSIPNPRRLWLQSPAAERKALAAEMARLKGNPAWPQLEAMIGAAIGFRPATLRKAKPAQLAIWIGEAAGRLSDELLEQLLVLVHFEGRQEMLSSVYDAFGIEHDGAEVEEEVLDAPVDPKKAKKGIAALAKAPTATSSAPASPSWGTPAPRRGARRSRRPGKRRRRSSSRTTWNSARLRVRLRT